MTTPGAEDTLVVARSRAMRAAATRHVLAIAVLIVMGGVAVFAFFGLRTVVRNQEHRLLEERAAEIGSYLQFATTQTASTLMNAGQAAAQDATSPLFTSIATPLTLNGASVGVARESAGSFVTIAGVGPRAEVGTPVSAQSAILISRALRSKGLVFDLFATPEGRLVVQAINVQGAKPRTVVYSENLLPPLKPTTPTSDSPYRELNAVIYVGRVADPDRIVLISGTRPTGDTETARTVVNFGTDSALVIISPRSPLVGSFAENVPWIVLGGGLLLAILLALLVDVLTRRRVYALNLVEQRTREMYRAQLAAEAANRSKSEFLSRMSHELRTPLNAVLGFGQLLELDELTPDQEEAVAQITKGGRHLLDLINEILDISQIETGTLAMSPEAVSVAGIVRETVDLIRPLAADRGVHLLGDEAASSDGFVFADRQRLKQILLNLLGNGIKYNREGGTVSISCARPEAGRMRIQVTDTGPGIPPEQFDLLFTPFERLGAEQTTVEGTGIGLALSRRLAEVMGGTLGVDSTVGRGSTFWVDLPLVEGPVARIERIDALGGAPVVQATDSPHSAVLHIEDNLSNIQLIERVLAQRPGINLIPAMQGRLGLELARQHQPILILLDLNLADVSGEDVLHALRDDPATSHIPVTIVSADAMPRQVQRLLAGGATDYLTKPFDVRKLLDIVDKAIQTSARRNESVGAQVGETPGG